MNFLANIFSLGLISKLLSVTTAILGLGLIIFIHECGHFIFSKIFGVKTPTFSIGIGPAILKTKIGQTEFQLGAVPLVGGYVEIYTDEENPKAPGNFLALPYPKKMAILFGGILFNLLTALIIYSSIDYTIGLPSNKTSELVVDAVLEDSIAKESLAPGDIIVGVNSFLFSDKEITYSKFQKEIIKSKGSDISLLVKKKESEESSWIKISLPDSSKTSGILGIMMKEKNHPPKMAGKKSMIQSIKNAIYEMKEKASLTVKSFSGMIKDRNLSGIAGPVAILGQGAELVHQGFADFLLFLAFISLSLGLLNFLPIPVFDGGRIFTTTLEAITGRKHEMINTILQLSSAFFLLIGITLISYREIKMIITKLFF